MIRFLVFLAILLAGVIGAPYLMGNQGYVMISAGNFVIDATVSSAVLMVVGFYFAILAIEAICNKIFYSLGWLNRHNKKKAKTLTEKGILALASGDFKKAEKLTIKAVSKSQVPVLNYLAAAESAQNLGQEKDRDEYLRLAHENAKTNTLAVDITQAKLQIKQKQFEFALASLTRLHEQHPKHKVVLALLKDVYLERKEWKALLALLPKLQKQKIMTAEEVSALRDECYFNSLAQIANQEGSTGLLNTFSKLPKIHKNNEDYMVEVVKQLMGRNDHQSAYMLIMDALSRDFYPELIKVSPELDVTDRHPLIERLRVLQKSREGSGLLAVVIGQLLAKESRWDEALKELTLGIQQVPSLPAYAALAQTYEKLNKPAEAKNVYKTGFEFSLEA